MTCTNITPPTDLHMIYCSQEWNYALRKQLEANRRNSRKSTGPKSPEGNSNSSRNNLRLGLTGQISLLPTEDREAHDAFCNGLIDGFNPQTPMERQLAQSVAEDNWHLNRAVAIENNMFALGHQHERREIQIALADAATLQAQADKFNLLSIYEQRINRNLQRNMNLLRELQAEREAQRGLAVEEAKLLAQLNLINGLARDPEFGRTGANPLCGSPLPGSLLSGSVTNGFVFSTEEIDRDNRLKAARQAKITPSKVPIQRLAGARAA